MKNRKSSTLAVAPGADGPLTVTECFNLRPDYLRPELLRPVGPAARLTAKAYKPVGVMRGMLFVADGRDLLWMPADADTDTIPELVATLPARPRFVLDNGRTMAVMTDAGPYMLAVGADGRPSGLALLSDVRPALTITAVEQGPFTETLPSMAMTEVGGAATDAAARLIDRVDAAGLYCQPVLASCRILAADGTLLHRTPPVMVASSFGGQLADVLRFEPDGADASRVHGRNLQLIPYSLRVSLADALPAQVALAASRLEVWVTPQFHTVDTSGEATVETARAGSEQWVSVRLPLADTAVASSVPAGSAHVLKRAFAGFDDVAVLAASVAVDLSEPFAVTVGAPGATAYGASRTALSRLMAGAPERVDALVARVSLPNVFSAEGVAVNGDMAVWHGLKPIAFPGYAPEVFASAVSQDACTVKVRVDMDNGDCRISTFRSTVRPTALGPVLSYPDPHAVRLCISVAPDNTALTGYAFGVPLEPDASGRAAVYVHPSVSAFRPEKLDGDVPDFSDAEARSSDMSEPSAIMATHIGNVYMPCVLGHAGAGVVTVASMPRCAAYGVEGRRFLVFTEAGTLFASLPSSGGSLRLWNADSRTVASAQCVAVCRHSVVALYGEWLVRFGDNGPKAITGRYMGDLIGYDAERDELVVARSDDNEAIHVVDDRGTRYTASLPYPSAWLSACGRIFATTIGGLVAVCSRDNAASVSVRWKAWTETLDGHGRARLPRAVTWRVKAASVSGTMDVERPWLSDREPMPAMVHRFKVQGRLISPLTGRLHGHPSHQVRLSLAAVMSPDACVAEPYFTL